METRIDTVAQIIRDTVKRYEDNEELSYVQEAADEIFKLFYGDVEEFRDREEELEEALKSLIASHYRLWNACGGRNDDNFVAEMATKVLNKIFDG